jgi:hypothetical protein
MSSHFDGHVLDFPGVSTEVASPQDELEGAATAGPVVEALMAFAPILRPLVVDVSLWAYRREDHSAVDVRNIHWSLVERDAISALRIDTNSADRVYRVIERVSHEAVGPFIAEAIAAEQFPADVISTWFQVNARAAEIKVPESLSHQEYLSLAVPPGDIGARIHRRPDGAWIRPPYSSDHGPLELVLANHFGFSLTATAYWSIWAPGGPGAMDVEKAVNELVARGWIVPQTYASPSADS